MVILQLNMSAYVVVHFLDTDEVELVPHKWVCTQGKNHVAYWPPFKSVAATTNAVRRGLSPDEATWTAHRARIMIACGK